MKIEYIQIQKVDFYQRLVSVAYAHGNNAKLY